MRTAGALAATGLLSFSFLGGIGACSSDETAAAAPVPDGGGEVPDSGSGGSDATDGSGPTKPGDPKRGSRLAPEFRETTDGASEFAGMVDTGLGNVPCFSSIGEDGVLRCLPTDAPYLGTAGAVYADSSCGTEIASIEAACTKPVFALRIDEGTTCNVGTNVYDVGAQHTTQIYRKEDATTCAPVASDPKLSYWVVGAKRAAADFVKLTKRTETIAGGIGLSMLDGDDGSSAPQYDLIDVARAKPCHEGKTTDGKTRCTPASTGYANGFIDDTCTKPAALVNPYDCDPLYVPSSATANTAANDGTEQVFELGAKQPTKDVFRQDNLTCDGPFPGSEDVYERGAEIAPASFPELGFANAGGSRILVKRWTAAGTTLFPTIEMHDAMLDVKCSWMRAADGKERCLPNGSVRQFSDDQCTVPVTRTSLAPPKYVIGFGTGCPRSFFVLAVGAEVMPKPANLYDNFNGTCIPAGSPGESTVYALGAEVPPSTFVEATRVTK